MNNKLGLLQLFLSRKATLCLLILIVSSIALFLTRLDSTAYAAIVSTIAVIYNYTQHKVDLLNSQLQSGASYIEEGKR